MTLGLSYIYTVSQFFLAFIHTEDRAGVYKKGMKIDEGELGKRT